MTEVQNLFAWMAQTIALGSAAAILPILFRLHHPRTQLVYCHLALAACLLLPWVQPWRRPRLDAPQPVRAQTIVRSATPAAPANLPPPAELPSNRASVPFAPADSMAPPKPSLWNEIGTRPILLWIVAAGALARFCRLLGGLWQIRRYRIAALPLYPIPESVRAAAAITHADALFCVSPELPGPVMLGWLAPVILMPESFLSLDEEAQCGIACHELLHVKRCDWLATLCEEVAAALLWFNPAAWVLLAQARLAREQLVDAETVRLTAAREPYIGALLAMARRPTLDLAPAPVFLRRRHLTQRMHSLLKDVSMSKVRLLFSYGPITAILGFAGWFSCLSFPLTGQPQAVAARADSTPPRVAVVPPMAQVPAAASAKPASKPLLLAFQAPQPRNPFAEQPARLGSVPLVTDPHEPVAGSIQIASSPSDRAAALALLERARQNGLTHRSGTEPYRLDASFSASGSAAYTGAGQLTETWLSGSKWLWMASLGNYSVTRTVGFGSAAGEKFPGAVAMRVHNLRNAIFWAIQGATGNQIRTAPVQINGRPATCILLSNVVAPTEQTRLWEESEYCIDDASGLIQVHSIAPGTYSVYRYDKTIRFNGLSMPDGVAIYENGALALNAQITLADAGMVDERDLRPTQEMLVAGRVAVLALWNRFPIDVPTDSVSNLAKPVIVHASVDGFGRVVEEEISMASDPALEQSALEVVKNAKFAATDTQQQMYINVRFVPK